jgi:hypothetical protein
MTRMRSMLFGMAASVLAGCMTSADPSTDGSIASSGPATSEPNVITPGDADAAGAPQDETAMSQFTSTPVAGLPQCNQYSATATVNGTPQPLTGEACQQPDGSWSIAEQPAGSSIVYQTVYWPPVGVVAYNACGGDFYNYPCLYNFPFGFSIGFPVFIDVYHRFHHFDYNAQFHHYGPIGHFGPMGHFAHVGAFHDGFHNGFHEGFHDGFHRDFAGGFHGQFPGGFSGGGFHHK